MEAQRNDVVLQTESAAPGTLATISRDRSEAFVMVALSEPAEVLTMVRIAGLVPRVHERRSLNV